METMETETMGRFIATLRKERGLTQRALAEGLHITDKAVSKWERGLSCPDISLLQPLAEQLGVTVGELLAGRRSAPVPESEPAEALVSRALEYAAKSARDWRRALRRWCLWGCSLALLLGVIVCGICDLAISGGITWARYPIAACVFAWLVSFPGLRNGVKGIPLSLLGLTALLLPFLWLLENFSGAPIMPIAWPVSAVFLGYLWAGYGLFRFLPGRKGTAVGVLLLLGIPVCLLINLSVSKVLDAPFLDMWDWLTMSLLALLALPCFFGRSPRLRFGEGGRL